MFGSKNGNCSSINAYLHCEKWVMWFKVWIFQEHITTISFYLTGWCTIFNVVKTNHSLHNDEDMRMKMTYDGCTNVKFSSLQPLTAVGSVLWYSSPVAIWYCAFTINANTTHILNAVPESRPFRFQIPRNKNGSFENIKFQFFTRKFQNICV